MDVELLEIYLRVVAMLLAFAISNVDRASVGRFATNRNVDVVANVGDLDVMVANLNGLTARGVNR
jgi:hypothetical protein